MKQEALETDNLYIRTIRALREERGIPPTTDDLAEVLEVSRTRVGQVLSRLRERGLVTWERGKSRTLRVV